MLQRPQTTVVLAMSADGKIADSCGSPARFGSATDKAHLETQVALADGVIFGANTLRAYGTTLAVTNPQLLQARKARSQSPQPVQIVVSATAKLTCDLPFFVSQYLVGYLLLSKSQNYGKIRLKVQLKQAPEATIELNLLALYLLIQQMTIPLIG